MLKYTRPFYLVFLYLLFIILLYFFGPIQWQTHNTSLLIFYYAAMLLSVFLGYFISSKFLKKRRFYQNNQSLRYKNKWVKRAKYMAVIYIVWKTILVLSTYGGFIGVANSFLVALKNPSDAYYRKLEAMTQGTDYLKLFINMLFTPFIYIFIMNTLYDRNDKTDIILATVLMLIDSLNWILQGTNKGIFDIVIIFITLWLLSDKNDDYNKNNGIKTFISMFILVFVALFIFNKFIGSRIGSPKIYRQNGSYLKSNYFIEMYFSSGFYFFIVYLSSYLTQGIYALSIALNLSTSIFTFGFGHSWFLLNVYEKVLKLGSLREKTYIFELQNYDLDPYVNWHSLMTWWFSDFGKIGSLLVLMFFSHLLFKHFYQALGGNVFSLSLYPLIITVFIFLPANNQVFSFVESFFSFWFIYILSARMNYLARCEA